MVVFNEDIDQIKIEGIWYSGDFFRQLAHDMPIGKPFEIAERRDTLITVKKHECKKAKEERAA